MTEHDARIARTVLVDELNTTNKYEAMAENAKSDKVKDVVKDIAREEKVHVGEAAALLDDEDPEATPAMKEGVEEVKGFKESAKQMHFSELTGNMTSKDPNEPPKKLYDSLAQTQFTNPSKTPAEKKAGVDKAKEIDRKNLTDKAYEDKWHETKSGFKRSMPSFASIFANERGRVLEKTGMMTDDAILEFKKSTVKKAGYDWVINDYDDGITRVHSLPSGNGANNIGVGTLIDYDPKDKVYVHDSQQNNIAQNVKPIGRQGMTHDEVRDKRAARRQKTDEMLAKEKAIEDQYRSGEIPTTEVKQPTLEEINAKDQAEQNKLAAKEAKEQQHRVINHVRAPGQYMPEGEREYENEQEGYHDILNDYGNAPAPSASITGEAFNQMKAESPTAGDGKISATDMGKLERLMQEKQENAKKEPIGDDFFTFENLTRRGE